MMTRKTDWFLTYSGKKFYPCEPEVDDICIEDIAHSLSLQARFAGHTQHLYSVAQHCLLVSENVPPALAIVGLLHDAAEAYCQDLIRPIKHSVGMERYREIEHSIEKVIAEKFQLTYPWPDVIKHHDNRALQTERRDLFKAGVGGKFEWHLEAEPYQEVIVPIGPWLAEGKFLRRFMELTGQPVDFDGVTLHPIPGVDKK